MATLVSRGDALASSLREEAWREGEGRTGWLPADMDSMLEPARPAFATESRIVSVVLAVPAIVVTSLAVAFAVLTRPIAALRVAWGATHDAGHAVRPSRLAR